MWCPPYCIGKFRYSVFSFCFNCLECKFTRLYHFEERLSLVQLLKYHQSQTDTTSVLMHMKHFEHSNNQEFKSTNTGLVLYYIYCPDEGTRFEKFDNNLLFCLCRWLYLVLFLTLILLPCIF